MLRFTARFAQEWNRWGTPTITREVVARLHAACETENRDPATVRKTTQALVYIVDDANVVEKVRAKVSEGRSLVGTSEQLTTMIAEYRDIGIDEFCLPDFNLGDSFSQRKETIQRFFTEVASHFRN
jgi:alkanesulfonate monooxygenase SsuD/methylene tetrahydromethanopterin reductase-like flavin-dependent oxidoreductase (luciferase family)